MYPKNAITKFRVASMETDFLKEVTRVQGGDETFVDFVERNLPVLVQGGLHPWVVKGRVNRSVGIFKVID